MRSVTQTRTLAAADPNGIAEDQQLGAAGDLALDGVLVTGGVAELGAQRLVTLESAGDISGTNFTVTGTDDSGNIVTETVAGPNTTTIATAVNFRTVTQIAADASFATDVEVGTSGVGASQEIPLDQNISPFAVSLGIVVTGTIDVTSQFTFDDVFEDNSGPHTWFNHTDQTNIVANDEAAIISPVKAVRLLTNSGLGTARFEVLQAGIR